MFTIVLLFNYTSTKKSAKEYKKTKHLVEHTDSTFQKIQNAIEQCLRLFLWLGRNNDFWGRQLY